MYTLALFLVLVHLGIHGNWSKFEENLFSRGFVTLFESFRKFLRCFKMFCFCRTGTPGIDRTLSYGAIVSAWNSKNHQKFGKNHQDLAKISENLAKVIENLAKISENLAKIHQNALKSNENFMFCSLKWCQRHLVAIFWPLKS